jgi:tripartite-type tricarboxylate transporter receptor subunit TctC
LTIIISPRKCELPLRKRFLGLVTAVITACAFSLPVQADPVSDFYGGRTISIMVGFGPGGGYDLYARAIAALGRACAGAT